MAAELLQLDSEAWGSEDRASAMSASMPAPLPGPAVVPIKPSPPSSPSSGPATVVVVGAGPAGLLAAAFLATRHGCRVRVYERRPHPGPIPMPPGSEDDNDRAFALALNSRGIAAVEAAGLSVEGWVATPGAQLAIVRDQLLGRGDRLPDAEGRNANALLLVPAERTRVVGSRQAFVRGLLHLVEEQQQGRQQPEQAAAGAAGGRGGSISFHFGEGFVSADLAAKTATFKADSGKTSTVRYDLLVGADGAWSKVRAAASAQHPQLAVTTTPANRQYKVVRGLAPVAHLSLMPQPGARPGSSASYGRLLMVTEAPAALAAAGGGPPGTLFASQPTADAVTAVLTWPHERWEAAGIGEGSTAGPEVYTRQLAGSFPGLPEAWATEMASQLAVRPLHETGTQVHLSQLHAPGVVLLGDAAHAVSPATSNGMNSALEDALVLHQALTACGDDLAALPQRYTAARLEDVRALLWLDGALSAVAGRRPAASASGSAAGQQQKGGEGKRTEQSGATAGAPMPGPGAPPDARASKAAVVARVALSKLTGGWVRPHALILLKDGTLPYAEARRQVERDAAVAQVLISPLTLAAGVAALAAAGMGMVRSARP